MITIKDINNIHNNALFNDNESVLASEYMGMIAKKYNYKNCSLIMSKDGKVIQAYIN